MGEPLELEARHFVSCIAAGKPPLTGGEAGLRVVRVLAAAQRSLDADGAPAAL
jgi:predicted dehydrogenase